MDGKVARSRFATGQLSFEAGDPLLQTFHSMESSLEATHPASQGRAFFLQARAQLGKPMSVSLLPGAGGSSRSDETASRRGHVKFPR
jgi:hypothetical protein